MNRRNLLQSGALAFVSTMLLSSQRVLAGKKGVSDRTSINPLVEALRATDKPVCIALANSLETRIGGVMAYSLHLRRAALDVDDAELIASAIAKVHQDKTLRLTSFSLSYNPLIKAHGVATVLSELPNHIAEFGLVGCNLDDRCENSITAFLARSKDLKMVCVEDNNFSPRVKDGIRKATQHLADCTTIV